jgi:hypothetical protein
VAKGKKSLSYPAENRTSVIRPVVIPDSAAVVVDKEMVQKIFSTISRSVQM